MPSKKPIIHFNTDQWIIDKMKYIAEENNRSLAKEVEYLCKQNIKKYEAEHGEIQIDEISQSQNATGKKILKTISGVALGEAAADLAVNLGNKTADKVLEHIKKDTKE